MSRGPRALTVFGRGPQTIKGWKQLNFQKNENHWPSPLTPATATIVAFEVIIGHNSRPDCARESVKTSSASEDSNASCEVCCAYLWRHCYMFREENSFFMLPKKLVVFIIRKAMEWKLNNLEIKFLHKKCQLWPWLCESNWKNELFWGVKRCKTQNSGLFYLFWAFEW